MTGPHRLAHNEHPFPTDAIVRAALHRATADLNRYPAFRPEQLISLFARWQGVPAESVAVGPGAGGVAHDLFRALLNPGDRVVFADPGFELYPMLCAMTGAAGVGVPLGPGGRHDLAATARAVTGQTRLVVIINPHNPTGTLLSADELDVFLRQVPPHVVVLVDEAYIDFAGDAALPDPLDRLAAHPRLVILRTLSKSHGLAALRIGYALAAPGIVSAVRAQQVPFSMNQVQLAAATAAVAAEIETRRRIGAVVERRERMRIALLRYGWPVAAGRANFLWVDGGDAAAEAVALLAAAGVDVRHHCGQGVRISVGDEAANAAVLAALSRIPVRAGL